MQLAAAACMVWGTQGTQLARFVRHPHHVHGKCGACRNSFLPAPCRSNSWRFLRPPMPQSCERGRHALPLALHPNPALPTLPRLPHVLIATAAIAWGPQHGAAQGGLTLAEGLRRPLRPCPSHRPLLYSLVARQQSQRGVQQAEGPPGAGGAAVGRQGDGARAAGSSSPEPGR